MFATTHCDNVIDSNFGLLGPYETTIFAVPTADNVRSSSRGIILSAKSMIFSTFSPDGILLGLRNISEDSIDGFCGGGAARFVVASSHERGCATGCCACSRSSSGGPLVTNSSSSASFRRSATLPTVAALVICSGAGAPCTWRWSCSILSCFLATAARSWAIRERLVNSSSASDRDSSC